MCWSVFLCLCLPVGLALALIPFFLVFLSLSPACLRPPLWASALGLSLLLFLRLPSFGLDHFSLFVPSGLGFDCPFSFFFFLLLCSLVFSLFVRCCFFLSLLFTSFNSILRVLSRLSVRAFPPLCYVFVLLGLGCVISFLLFLCFSIISFVRSLSFFLVSLFTSLTRVLASLSRGRSALFLRSVTSPFCWDWIVWLVFSCFFVFRSFLLFVRCRFFLSLCLPL